MLRTTLRRAKRRTLMKRLLILLFAAVFLRAGNVAHAQDFAPPRLTTPVPEAATPTPTPTPAPSATAQSQPSARATSPSSEKRSEQQPGLSAPRRDVLNEPAVHAVEKPAPFARETPAPRARTRSASRPTFDLGESSWVTAATIRSLENRWETAVKDHDVDALKDLLAPDFEATNAKGTTAGRERIVSLLRRDKNVHRSTRAHGMHVRSIGEKTVVVTGISTESGVTADGKKFKISRSFTDTWKQRKSGWQCVSSRVTQGEHD